MLQRHLLSNELDLLLDDEVGFGVAQLRTHVDECAECQERLEQARVVTDALERLPHFTPKVGFADRVMSQVQVIEPWQVAVLDTARRFVPESRPLRALALAGAGVASLTVSASAVWIAFSANLTFQSATFVTGRLREALLNGGAQAVEAALGSGAAGAIRSSGLAALAAGAFALVATVGAAAFGFRALATTARQRGS